MKYGLFLLLFLLACKGDVLHVSSIEPQQGRMYGGDTVQIHGGTFPEPSGYRVYFGKLAAEKVIRVDEHTLQTKSPSQNAPGPVDITVVADHGPATKVPKAFTYTQ